MTIKLSSRRADNIINIKGNDYQLKRLNDNFEFSKGGNSNLFILYDMQNQTELVIKFCKQNYFKNKDNKRIRRFWQEIFALNKAKAAKLNKVINIIQYGIYNHKDKKSGNKYRFVYYITEKAEFDLTEYILNGKLSNNMSGKVQICRDIIESLRQLHSLGIYHRDIKPENILFFSDGTWKICDLGLLAFRNNNYSLDNDNEMIGPRGWLSPEATNKYYTYKKDTEFQFDCTIDGYSDIFQLGKVFWFIFQTNVPIGRIKRHDFELNDDSIYAFLIWMLNHNKTKRPNLDLIQSQFHRITYRKYF